MHSRWRPALLVFCFLVLGLLALQVLTHGPMLELDRAVTAWMTAYRRTWVTEPMLLVSSAHQTWKLLAVTALLAAWRGWRGDSLSVRALVVVPVGMLLNVLLKDSFRRARPALDDPLVQIATYSFPSGHAVASTVFYGMVCTLVFAHARSRGLRAFAATVAVAMVLLVCASRVYLGAHFVSDVIAGIAEGTICVLLFQRFLRLP
jgi:undecaprenyl-diphosphatase